MCRPLAYGESRDIIGRDDVVRRDRAECSANACTTKRMVPNTVVGDATAVAFNGAHFAVTDLGPSESPTTARGSRLTIDRPGRPTGSSRSSESIALQPGWIWPTG